MKVIVPKGAADRGIRAIALFCVAVFAAGAGAVYWQYTRYNHLRSEVSAVETQLQQSRTIAEQLGQTQTRFETMRHKIQHLEMSVSERAYIPTLLKQLEESAKTRQLKVLSVRPTKEGNQSKTESQQESNDQKSAQKKPAEPYDKQTIEVSVQGRFWDVMQFIDDLDRFPKILAVERVQMRPRQRKEPTDPFQVEAQFTFTAFIFKGAEGGARS